MMSVPPRPQLRPSAHITGTSHRSRRFGIEVHRLLQKIDWADETMIFPDNPVGDFVHALFGNDVVRSRFEHPGDPVDLLKEQPVDALLTGKWLSGVIDRIHLHHSPSGEVTRVEIMEFKTDRIDSPQQLLARHRAQMIAYAQALRVIYPQARIQAWLLSTHMQAWIEMAIED